MEMPKIAFLILEEIEHIRKSPALNIFIINTKQVSEADNVVTVSG